MALRRNIITTWQTGW